MSESPESISKDHVSLPSLEPDPVIEAYKRDVDRTLLRENLRLTPQQRFEKFKAMQEFAVELRRAGKAVAKHG